MRSILLPNETLSGDSPRWQSLRDQLRAEEEAKNLPLVLSLAAQMSAVAITQVPRWRKEAA